MRPRGDETLFCRTALDRALLTHEQISECQAIQARTRKPLVVILIEQGYLDDKILNQILDAVTSEQEEESRDAGSKLFGAIAVREGYVTSDQLRECLRFQETRESAGKSVRIGQVLREKGYMTPHQVQAVLGKQGKRIVRCNGCKAKFNLSGYDPRREYTCRKCGLPLAEQTAAVVVDRAADSTPQRTLSQVTETAAASLIGHRVGEFEIVEMVGEGGMAEVYKAFRATDNEIRALKIMKGSAAADRFKREIKNARRLDHPNVIEVYDDGVYEGRPYFFMEYIDGESLADKMERITIPFEEVIEIVRQVGSALAAAHAQGIIHRDIKPSNLLLDNDTEGNWVVKITDFGIARSSTDTQVTVAGELLGTFKYMAPEHIKGMPSTGTADIFSLGVLTYELLSGREPFLVDSPVGYLFVNIRETPPPVSSINPDLSRGVDAVVARMLEKDPEQRYDAATLLGDLEILSSHVQGTGDLVEFARTRSVFFVSGGRRLLHGVKNFFSGKLFGAFRKTRTDEEPPELAFDEEFIEVGETEELEVTQEARMEFEWALQLEAQGNLEGAIKSLQALIDVVSPTNRWVVRAHQKLDELKEKVQSQVVETARKQQEEGTVQQVANLEKELEEIEALAAELEVPSSTQIDPALAYSIAESRASDLIEEDRRVGLGTAADGGSIEAAQESLASAKTFVDNLKTLGQYSRGKERLETIFQHFGEHPDWKEQAAGELAEILFQWGTFLARKGVKEEALGRFWKLLASFPGTRYAALAVEAIVSGELLPDMVHVPRGAVAPANGEKPLEVASFFIDRNLVTNSQYKGFIDATGFPAPRTWKNKQYPLGKGNHPVSHVSWTCASEFARWTGKRLPTQQEWILAARGESTRRWPWKEDAFEEAYCNTRSRGIGDTTPVGSYPEGASPYGCLDMIGNLWEWTSTSFEEGDEARILMGGSWFTYEEFCRIDYQNFDSPRTASKLYGFRCVRGLEDVDANPENK